MQLLRQTTRRDAFSSQDLVLTLSCTTLLLSLVFACVGGASVHGQARPCASQLRELGVAILQYSEDHNGLPPTYVRVEEGGAYGSQSTFLHYRPLQPYLKSPRSLACPTSGRTPAKDFAELRSDGQVSYTLSTHLLRQAGLNLMAMDGDLQSQPDTSGCGPAGGILTTRIMASYRNPASFTVRWSNTNHMGYGHLLLRDGSVLFANTTVTQHVFGYGSEESGSFHLLVP